MGFDFRAEELFVTCWVSGLCFDQVTRWWLIYLCRNLGFLPLLHLNRFCFPCCYKRLLVGNSFWYMYDFVMCICSSSGLTSSSGRCRNCELVLHHPLMSLCVRWKRRFIRTGFVWLPFTTPGACGCSLFLRIGFTLMMWWWLNRTEHCASFVPDDTTWTTTQMMFV